MEKKNSPAEWTDPGQLTEEQIRKIMEPIGGMPEEPAIEVEPEPESELEITIEGEAAPEEPPIVIDLDEEPQAVPSPAPEMYAHDQMVKAILNLLRGVYRARHNGQEPDEKYVSRMRDMYANQSDEHLRQAVDILMKEAVAFKKAA